MTWNPMEKSGDNFSPRTSFFKDKGNALITMGSNMVSEGDLVDTANSIGWALTQGIPVGEEEINAFVWITMTHAGNELSDEAQSQINYTPNEVRAYLAQRQQLVGGPTQELTWFDKAMGETDVAISDETANLLIAGVIQGGTVNILRGLMQSSFAGATASGLRTAGSTLARGATSHKGITTVLGLATMAGVIQGVGQETGDNLVQYGGDNTPTDMQPEMSNYMLVDKTTGETVEIPQDEANAAGIGDTAGTAIGFDLSPELLAMAEAFNIDPAVLAQMQGFNAKTEFNPGVAGTIELPYSSFPYGINLQGQPLSQTKPLQEIPPSLGGYASKDQRQFLGPLAGYVPSKEDYLGSLSVSPGGVIMPNAFKAWSNGQTLMEIAGNAAADFGIPVDVLYGLVTQESGWNPFAVGDNGQSHGLVQIYAPAHPEVTVAQANNPTFALRWAAQNLLNNYKRYGSWELAVIAHRSPEGATYLAQNGEFKSELDRNYLSNIATYAMQSSLGNTIFGGAGSALAEAGTSTAATPAPPYSAPDPATLKEYVESTYANELGREPTPEEMDSKVKELEGIYRKAYSQSVRNFRGLSSTEVNPGDEFTRMVKESGEGQFYQESKKRDSMHQYMGNVAAILSGGY